MTPHRQQRNLTSDLLRRTAVSSCAVGSSDLAWEYWFELREYSNMAVCPSTESSSSGDMVKGDARSDVPLAISHEHTVEEVMMLMPLVL